MTKRAIIKSKYESYWGNYLDSLGSKIDIEFVSSYAPVIIADVSSSNVNTLSRNNDVQNLYLYDQTVRDALSVSRNVIRANTLQSSGIFGYTGEGVKVGILEASGFPDNSLLGLSESDNEDESKIFYDPSCVDNKWWHASLVSMIIAGQGLNGNAVGIAPGVSLYVSYMGDDANPVDNIQWLVEQGVNVINISFDTENTNIYDVYGKLIDYYSYNFNVTFVIASGNTDIDGVSLYGMSYNAITVGNTNDNNTSSVLDDVLDPRTNEGQGSGYKNYLSVATASKPDICAPGSNIFTTEYNNKTGTSFSAPHITGLVALLGEQNPLLLYSPVAMKAVLTAGVHRGTHDYVPSERIVTTDPYNPASSYIQYGAGIASGAGSAVIAYNETYDVAALLSDTLTTTYTISCTANEDVRISLAFFVGAQPLNDAYTSFSYDLHNLDLEVYNSSGVKVGSSTTTYNNLEIVDFTATSAGNYTIKINRISKPGTVLYYGLAWT